MSRLCLREVLYELPVEAVFSGVVVVENPENIEQCGLAGAGCSHNGYVLPFLNAEVNAFQHVKRLAVIVCLIDILEFYKAHYQRFKYSNPGQGLLSNCVLVY